MCVCVIPNGPNVGSSQLSILGKDPYVQAGLLSPPLVTGSWQVRLGSEILASEFTLPPSILLPEEPGAAEQRAGKKPVITKFMETGVRA